MLGVGRVSVTHVPVRRVVCVRSSFWGETMAWGRGAHFGEIREENTRRRVLIPQKRSGKMIGGGGGFRPRYPMDNMAVALWHKLGARELLNYNLAKRA